MPNWVGCRYIKKAIQKFRMAFIICTLYYSRTSSKEQTIAHN